MNADKDLIVLGNWLFDVGCVYFRKTTKPRQTNSLSDSAARLDVKKDGDMKISPEMWFRVGGRSWIPWPIW